MKIMTQEELFQKRLKKLAKENNVPMWELTRRVPRPEYRSKIADIFKSLDAEFSRRMGKEWIARNLLISVVTFRKRKLAA